MICRTRGTNRMAPRSTISFRSYFRNLSSACAPVVTQLVGLQRARSARWALVRAVGPSGAYPIQRPDDDGARKRNVDNEHNIGLVADHERSLRRRRDGGWVRLGGRRTHPRVRPRRAGPQPDACGYGAGVIANSRRAGRIETIATHPGRCRHAAGMVGPSRSSIGRPAA